MAEQQQSELVSLTADVVAAEDTRRLKRLAADLGVAMTPDPFLGFAAAMPLVAWVVAAFVFHLSPHDVLIVTVLAALPTAQNVFVYAATYDRGTLLARDVILLSTLLSVPVLVGVAVVLG